MGCELEQQEICSRLLRLSPPALVYRLKIYSAKTPSINKGVSLAVDFNTVEYIVSARRVPLNITFILMYTYVKTDKLETLRLNF